MFPVLQRMWQGFEWPTEEQDIETLIQQGGLARYLNGDKPESFYPFAIAHLLVRDDDIEPIATHEPFGNLRIHEGDPWFGWIVDWQCVGGGTKPTFVFFPFLANYVKGWDSNQSKPSHIICRDKLTENFLRRIDWLANRPWYRRKIEAFPPIPSSMDVEEESIESLRRRAVNPIPVLPPLLQEEQQYDDNDDNEYLLQLREYYAELIQDYSETLITRDISDYYDRIYRHEPGRVTVFKMDLIEIDQFSIAPIPAIKMRGPVSIRVTEREGTNDPEGRRIEWTRIRRLFRSLIDHFEDVRAIVFSGYRIIKDLDGEGRANMWTECIANDRISFLNCAISAPSVPVIIDGLARARRINTIGFFYCRLNLSILHDLENCFLGNIKTIKIEGNGVASDPLHQALKSYFNPNGEGRFAHLFRRIIRERLFFSLKGYGSFPSYVDTFFGMINSESHRELFAFFFHAQERLFDLLCSRGNFVNELMQFELDFYRNLKMNDISQHRIPYDRIFVINQVYNFLNSRNLLLPNGRDVFYPITSKNNYTKTILLALYFNDDPNQNREIKDFILTELDYENEKKENK